MEVWHCAFEGTGTGHLRVHQEECTAVEGTGTVQLRVQALGTHIHYDIHAGLILKYWRHHKKREGGGGRKQTERHK